MKFAPYLFLTVLSITSFCAQAQEPRRADCGVGLIDGLRIKERMLMNRRSIPSELWKDRSRAGSTLHVPVQITIVRDGAGNGGIDLDKVFSMFCDLNDDYSSIGIQFHLKDSINSFRYVNNSSLYNNAQSENSETYMTNIKVPDCLNMYIGPSMTTPYASFYSPLGDYIFLLSDMLTGSDKTAAHEVGHFLSLPHTFFGWEGVDFDLFLTAPDSIFGVAVEHVARTGPTANCAEAADGFCDTDADYLSNVLGCPYNAGGNDPVGVPIDPDETMIMSYFTCKSAFSQEQQEAMVADIYARGWDTFTLPLPDDAVNGASVASFDPPTQSILPYGTDISFTWDPVPGANGYVFSLMKLGGTFVTILRTDVYDTSMVVPLALLEPNANYRWRVKPFNQNYTCSGYSPYQILELEGFVGLDEQEVGSFDVRSITNPISGGSLDLTLFTTQPTECQLMLFSTNGSQQSTVGPFHLGAGLSSHSYDVSSLAAGMYILEMTNSSGAAVRKRVILTR